MTTRRKPLIPPGGGQPSISRCGSDAQWLRRANPGRSRSRADSRSGGAPLAPPLVPQGIFVEEPAQQGPPIELPPRSLGLSDIYPPCIRRTRVAPERRTQGDDASNVIRHCLRHFACIDAAEAPTDQRNLPAGFGA